MMRNVKETWGNEKLGQVPEDTGAGGVRAVCTLREKGRSSVLHKLAKARINLYKSSKESV